MNKPQDATSKLLHEIKDLALMTIPLFLGLLASFIMAKVPSAGGLIVIPVNPLVIATLFLSFVMVYRLGSFLKNLKNMLVFLTFFVSYTIIIYLDGVETKTAVSYSFNIVYFLLVIVYLVAVSPFLAGKNIVSFQQSIAKVQSISFAACIMWLSPFCAEMFVWLRWYALGDLWQKLGYMVLGGAGTGDLLFYFGFWALVSMACFHILRRLLFKEK
jgi:hypothetical protein